MFETLRRGSFLPYGRQFLSRSEYRAVRRVLKSPFLTQGPCVERFEEALKELTGAPYAVAVSNGTVALDLAVRAVKIQRGLRRGALALSSPNTFVASGNALLYNQLKPLFCDISAGNYNLGLREAESLLARHNGSDSIKPEPGMRPIELLLPVHFAGEPVDMARLWQLARQYAPSPSKESDAAAKEAASGASSGSEAERIPIIEDAAHALGSCYENTTEAGQERQVTHGWPQSVGSCAYSDACCFSFHPVKTATTGEGGAITCRDPQLFDILLLLRNHGINRNPNLWRHAGENCQELDLVDSEPPPWYYEMQELGYNARLSDIHAALGVEQLHRLGDFCRQRCQLVRNYNNAFHELEWLRTPQSGGHSCPHLYVVQIDFSWLGLGRSSVMRELRRQGVGTQVHYVPVPMQPFYRQLGYTMDGLGNALHYYQSALSLPLYYDLRPREQDRVIRAVCRLGK